METGDLDFDYGLLRELTETDGVPGYEDRVREIVRRELEPEVDRLRTDAMGNVVGTLEGDSEYAVLVAAHMDEIGFMVRHVDDEGFLQLEALGGWDPRILRAQRVTVHTADEDLPGVIGSPPLHTLEEGDLEGTEALSDVRVDLGLPGDAVADRVAVGDRVTTDQRTAMVGDLVTAKALDNRVSVSALLETARAITDPAVTVHFAATAQEEVGLRGAEALGVDVEANLALALDTTVANDVPGVDPGEHVTELGGGVGLKLKDASTITNPAVTRRLREVATDRGIPHQTEIFPGGGTDTAGLQYRGGATPAGAVSVPTRYLHTPTEAVHPADVRACLDLVAAFLATETGEFDYTL